MSRRRLALIAMVILFAAGSLLYKNLVTLTSAVASVTPDVLGASDYNIVYLVADAVGIDSVMAPVHLLNTLGAQTVYSQEQLLTLSNDETNPIDALIIHYSAVSTVDREWLANAYLQGTVITGFNIWYPELAELVNDPCVVSIQPMPTDTPYGNSPFFVTITLQVSGEPDDVARILEGRQKGSCGSVPDIKSRTNVQQGSSNERLRDIRDYDGFAQRLLETLKYRTRLRE